MKFTIKSCTDDINQQIINGFTSNAQKKRALDLVRKTFDEYINKIQDYYLNVPVKQRTSAQTYIYYELPEIHLWKPNHSDMVRINLPQALSDVDAIEQLIELRNHIKSTDITVKVKYTDEMTSEMMTALESMFSPMDDEVLKSKIRYTLNRFQSLHEFKKTKEYEDMDGNSSSTFEKLFDIAGGKGWYIVFTENSKSGVCSHVERSYNKIKESRNLSIVSKLKENGATKINDVSFAHSVDGYNGIFRISTNEGEKAVKIQTIGAGGYNIQQYHHRVLINVSNLGDHDKNVQSDVEIEF